jgi:hypothetical protein
MYICIMQPLEQSLYNISKTSFLRDREKHRVDGALFIRTICSGMKSLLLWTEQIQ